MDDIFHALDDIQRRDDRQVPNLSTTEEKYPSFFDGGKYNTSKEAYTKTSHAQDPHLAYRSNDFGEYPVEYHFQPASQAHRHEDLVRRRRLSLAPNRVGLNAVQSNEQYTLATSIPPRVAPLHSFPPSLYEGRMSSPSAVGLPSSPSFSASQRQRSNQPYGNQSKTGRPITFHGSGNKPKYGKPAHTQTMRPKALTSARPVVQGIELVPTHELPDRLRAVFKFPLFNAIQSKCFRQIFQSNDNFVLSSPTGSGKTAIFELAICRLVSGCSNNSFKIIYMAPTKSLCSERARDWKAKFAPLNLTTEEMTGDSDTASLRAVKTSDIIVTTPEKWDSITRKWKDHARLVEMVKLFLIDEVHILNKDRGATLEAVVSRMKSIAPTMRFVAVSATVPNLNDIASWIGHGATHPGMSAVSEAFGEEFRPVPLQKHVCGYEARANDFAFDSLLTRKLPEIITRYSSGKPILIFCFTRASCKSTAEALARWWSSSDPRSRRWSAPSQRLMVQDHVLRALVPCGVAVHHAGLQTEDRATIEHAFLNGHLGVICCTSTLAEGVNLPCHLVIVKGTVAYMDGSKGLQEQTDLDILQMIGRAGRPQFDKEAVAVIMTKSQKVSYFDDMVSGKEIIESRLHLNLVEHFNAEIGLGTISDMPSATHWLSSTFLYVRLKANPKHYHLPGDPVGHDLDGRLDQICSNAISLLADSDLITTEPTIKSTFFGDAMARYYVSFESMKRLLSAPPKAKISEILSVLCQAHELREIRLRGGEKQVYIDVNKSSSMRFPFKVNIALPAQKVSLIIQATLAGIEDIATSSEHGRQFSVDQSIIFQHARRLIRCIVDCQSHMGDSVSLRNALMLVRSLGAKIWDDSPLRLQQLATLGPISVKRLIGAGIGTVEDLEASEPHQLERILHKNPPYGLKLLDHVRQFPRLRIDLRFFEPPMVNRGKHVTVKISAEFGFLNQKLPVEFNRQAIYVCILAETSDGSKLHFGRISAVKIGNGQQILLEARLTSPTQSVICYVACEEIAGTLQQASIKPVVSEDVFPINQPIPQDVRMQRKQSTIEAPNTSKARAPPLSRTISSSDNSDWGDGGLQDNDLTNFGSINDDFRDIDDLDIDHTAGTAPSGPSALTKGGLSKKETEEFREPERLPNGNWKCNHQCKDKTDCKHPCCKVGMESKPKRSKARKVESEASTKAATQDKTQTKLKLSNTTSTQKSSSRRRSLDQVDLSQQNVSQQQAKSTGSQPALRDLDRLAKSVKTNSCTRARIPITPLVSYTQRSRPALPFLDVQRDNVSAGNGDDDSSSKDYGDDMDDDWPVLDDFPMIDKQFAPADHQCRPTRSTQFPEAKRVEVEHISDDDEEEQLDAILVGAEDSYILKSSGPEFKDDMRWLDDDRPLGPQRPRPSKSTLPRAAAEVTSDEALPTLEDLPKSLSNSEGSAMFVTDENSSSNKADDSKARATSLLPAKRSSGQRGPAARETTPEAFQHKRVKTSKNLPDAFRDRIETNDASQTAYEIGLPRLAKPTETDATVEAQEESLETKRLRDWMLQEFGDSVELV